LGKERRLGVFENRVLRRIFELERHEVTGEWKNYIMRSLRISTAHLMICTAHLMICTPHLMNCTPHLMIVLLT
jgi:hypothetical protein